MPEIHVINASSMPDREACNRIRYTVFVDEQLVPADEEYDEYEPICQHYLVLVDAEPAGTLRWRITPQGKAKLERIAVLPNYRGLGVGAAAVLAALRDIPAGTPMYMHAQTHALPFYQKLGFVGQGERFMEAGIEHLVMVYQP
jgi:predicted GNAT family N-acyltransferase